MERKLLQVFSFLSLTQPPIPDPNNMRDFVSYPTSGNERLHCTMKRTEDDPEVGGPCYTLYLEYLGGLVPILKGRRISKLRPEFVIMDPKTDGKAGTKVDCYLHKMFVSGSRSGVVMQTSVCVQLCASNFL